MCVCVCVCVFSWPYIDIIGIIITSIITINMKGGFVCGTAQWCKRLADVRYVWDRFPLLEPFIEVVAVTFCSMRTHVRSLGGNVFSSFLYTIFIASARSYMRYLRPTNSKGLRSYLYPFRRTVQNCAQFPSLKCANRLFLFGLILRD